MKLLVTGGAGYLGSEVAALGVAAGWDVLATKLSRDPPAGTPVDLDLRDPGASVHVLQRSRPDVVIHTAYRQADEDVQADVVDATRHLSQAVAGVGARLIHLSTDLVFDGERAGRYTEDDAPRPVSRYGAAKLDAEGLVGRLVPDSLVVRTSLLYGKPGGAQEGLALRDGVRFYTDEIRTPVRVDDLAPALLELAEANVRGVLHVAGADAVSRYDFACALAAAQGRPATEIQGAPSPDASRARNVALDSSRAAALLRTRLRGVDEALHSL